MQMNAALLRVNAHPETPQWEATSLTSSPLSSYVASRYLSLGTREPRSPTRGATTAVRVAHPLLGFGK